MSATAHPPADPSAQTQHIGAGDTSALRALAHPARLAILGFLRTSGPATVGEVAAAHAIAPGSASFHLRTLARHGFVEETTAPSDEPDRVADRRTRWWRAAARRTHWEPSDFGGTAEGVAAVQELERSILDGYRDRAVAALERRGDLSEGWREAAYLTDDILHLSLEDTAELRRDVEALMERWRERSRPAAEAHGARPVALVVQTFPEPGVQPPPRPGVPGRERSS